MIPTDFVLISDERIPSQRKTPRLCEYTVASPLPELTKGGQRKFHWTPYTSRATTPFFNADPIPTSFFLPILVFTVYSDASNVGRLSTAQKQHENVVACASQALTTAKPKYTTTQKECTVYCSSCLGDNYWRTYLLGQQFGFRDLTNRKAD